MKNYEMGRVLYWLRVLNEVTIAHAGEAIGITAVHITNMENGRHGVTRKTIEKYAVAFDCTPKDIVNARIAKNHWGMLRNIIDIMGK